MFFDSHTHLNCEAYSDRERRAVINTIENSKVDYAVDVGTDLGSSFLTVQLVKELLWCYGAVGYHPHYADQMGDTELMMIKSLAKKDKIAAIGEIGLDFHYDNSERDNQRKAFRKQIRLAKELMMPIMIHSRGADQETMNILKEEGAFSDERKRCFAGRRVPEGGKEWAGCSGDARVMLHCYSGSAEMGRQYVKLGATLSIAGPVTYRNNKKTISVVEQIPIEFLLVETDAPFLAPEPLRGKKNVSPYIEHTVKKIAEIKDIDLEKAADETKKNAMVFFNIK